MFAKEEGKVFSKFRNKISSELSSYLTKTKSTPRATSSTCYSDVQAVAPGALPCLDAPANFAAISSNSFVGSPVTIY